MANKLNVKYNIGMSIALFEYKNYGFNITRKQKYMAISQWIWCKKNIG